MGTNKSSRTGSGGAAASLGSAAWLHLGDQRWPFACLALCCVPTSCQAMSPDNRSPWGASRAPSVAFQLGAAFGSTARVRWGLHGDMHPPPTACCKLGTHIRWQREKEEAQNVGAITAITVGDASPGTAVSFNSSLCQQQGHSTVGSQHLTHCAEAVVLLQQAALMSSGGEGPTETMRVTSAGTSWDSPGSSCFKLICKSTEPSWRAPEGACMCV